MPQPDSAELLDSLRENPSEALEEVFDHYRAALGRVVASRLDPRLAGRVDPSDVVQETLLEAHRRIDEYLKQPDLPLRRWLCLLAEQNAKAAYRWHARTQKRSIHREEPLELLQQHGDAPPAVISDNTDPQDQLIRIEHRSRLAASLQLLKPSERTAIQLRYLDGKSLQEVADHLGISRNAAAKRAIRALRKLADLMGN
ncbi:MAG: sigma-70 family RNA polymerase sigma factor [Planctomycetales bacterium]|nr:sigma-70 family RNA polymerase sigma factor [Planctomycetales bacterium]